ncbi:MAG: caspase family protein [Bacteroidota bacterium]
MSNSSHLFTQGYALLIGVNEQAHPDLQAYALPGVAKDIELLSKVLTHPERGGYPREHVRQLLGADANRSDIRQGFKWLQAQIDAAPSQDVTAVIYFSGHGLRTEIDEELRFFLATYDTDISDEEALNDTALKDQDFARYVKKIQAARVVVILDCCHAGASTAREMKLPIPIEKPPKEKPKPTDSKPIPIEKPPKEKPKPTDSKPIYIDMSQERLNLGSGRAVLLSSRDRELSYMSEGNKMGLFTEQLIRALTGHGPLAADATTVGILDVMNFVSQEVPKEAERLGVGQHPTFSFEGENYPLALLMGGKGLTGMSTPPALEETQELVKDAPTVPSIHNEQIIRGDHGVAVQGSKDVTITQGNITRGD